MKFVRISAAAGKYAASLECNSGLLTSCTIQSSLPTFLTQLTSTIHMHQALSVYPVSHHPISPESPQERGLQLFLRYGSRWGMEALRGLVDVTPLEPGRHCGQFQCPCQYIKEHLQCKPRGKFKCCNLVHWVMASERYDIDS